MSEGTQTHPVDNYEVSDPELQVLEEGVEDSLHITLATTLLALAAAFNTVLVIATFTGGAGAALLAAAVVMAGILIGALLLLALGIRQRRTKRKIIKSLVQEIRSRKPPVGE